MCGIAGKISWSSPPDPEVVRRMTGEMAVRGPDSDGLFRSAMAVLGHRRLSIIDLSHGADQPMGDSSGRFRIVYNGEVYNYPALKKQLIEAGHQFRTTSDTEVVLESYKAWGTECVERFNGMFALAIWDQEVGSLFLARDRLGKKPLFYYRTSDGGIVFGSELKALLHDPEIRREIDPQGLSQYLSLGYTLSDSSIIRGIRKLPAAHAMLLESNRSARLWRYWDLAGCFHEKRQISLEDAAESVALLLKDSCKLRLVSDVPLGAFLSGGLDSSAVAAALSRLQHPGTIRTFSIGFGEKSYSELPEARTVAKHLGVSHQERIVGADSCADLEAIVRAADEPFSDNSLIPMYYLSQFTRDHVTVALSGDGSDEIFCGYETYVADWIHRAAAWIPDFAVSGASFVVDRLLPIRFDKVSFDFKVRRFLQGLRLPFSRAHYSWRELHSAEDKARLLRPAWAREASQYEPFAVVDRYFDEVRDAHPLDQASYVDIKTWLVDDILVKADRMSMAHSLELRCPFLDFRLVEFAATLPVALKVKGFTTKRVLKHAQRNTLPESIIHRAKRGFNAPVSHWLAGNWGDEVERRFTSGSAITDVIRPEAVSSLLREHRAKRADHSFRLFNLLCLAVWMEQTLGGHSPAASGQRPR